MKSWPGGAKGQKGLSRGSPSRNIVRFANTMPGVAIVGNAGGIAHSQNVGDAACAADVGYAKDGASGSV